MRPVPREHRFAIRLLAAAAAMAAGCSGTDADFAGSFTAVEAGQTRAEVQAALGPPDESQSLAIPSEPYWGPAESLVSVLDPGTPFEQWLYRRDGQDHYLWFGSRSSEPSPEWRLLEKATYPTGAVFEAR